MAKQDDGGKKKPNLNKASRTTLTKTPIDYSKAREVSVVPAGYTEVVKDGETYFIKEGEKKPTHTPGTPGKPVPPTPKAPRIGKVTPRKPTPPTDPKDTDPEFWNDVVRMKKKTTIPEKVGVQLDVAGRSEFQENMNFQNPNFRVMEFSEAGTGGMSKATKMEVDRTTGRPIDPLKSFDEKGNYVPFFTGDKPYNQIVPKSAVSLAAGPEVNTSTTEDILSNTKNPVIRVGTKQEVSAPLINKKEQGIGEGLQDIKTLPGTELKDKTKSPYYNQFGEEDKITSPKFAKGGTMKAPKIKGYFNGGDVSPEEKAQGMYMQNGVKYRKDGVPILDSNYNRNVSQEPTSLNTQQLTYGTEFKAAEGTPNTTPDATTTDATPKQKTGKGNAVANKAGEALGAYGTGYYATKQSDTKGENVRNKALGAVSNIGPIGGAIGGIAAIGDQIGEPIKAKSEAVDNQGKLKDEGKARKNAIVGSLLSPSKALVGRGQYKGGYTDISGRGYTKHLEDVAKKEMAEEQFSASMGSRNERMNAAEGGTIKGKGGPKSDSILSRIGSNGIPSGSFVTPAENNDMAKAIRAKILGENPNKVAQFKKGGEAESDVAVSNGEHLFTPKEKKKITNLLGEEILEELAPEAEENDEKNCGGKVKLKKGGEVPEGTKLGKYYYKKGNWIDSGGNKLTKEFGQKYTDAYFKQTGGVGKEERDYKADIEAANLKNKPDSAIPTVTATQLESVQSTKPSILGGKKSAPKVGSGKRTGVEFVPKMTEDTGDYPMVPGTITGEPVTEAIDPRFKQKAPLSDAGASLLVDSAKKASDEYVPSKENKKSSILSGLGSALEYGAPLAQGLMGADYLKKAGKRPVDVMDADFAASVEKAKQNAAFGYTPEEKFAIDQQNQNLTNAARFTARNLSGGSAAVAQSNERAAINDAYARGLDSVIKGKQLQMDKQSYADQMIQAKQNKSRQLFQDTLGAWNQNQQAGASLLASGLQGMIGAKRYQETLNTMQEEEAARNAYKNIDYSKLIK